MSKTNSSESSELNISAPEMKALIEQLVEKGRVSAEEIKGITDQIRRDTHEQAMAPCKKELSPEQSRLLIEAQKKRFEKNNQIKKFQIARQKIEWSEVQKKLEANPEKMWILNEMARTGGEPDVIGIEPSSGRFIFVDCSREAPKGRVNVCYNLEGQEKAERNGWPADGNAVETAAEMGVSLLSEKRYRQLQSLGKFDVESWVWLSTPESLESEGRAVFGYHDLVGAGIEEDEIDLHDHYGSFRGEILV